MYLMIYMSRNFHESDHILLIANGFNSKRSDKITFSFVLVRGCLLVLIPTVMSNLFNISADIPPVALL